MFWKKDKLAKISLRFVKLYKQIKIVFPENVNKLKMRTKN